MSPQWRPVAPDKHRKANNWFHPLESEVLPRAWDTRKCGQERAAYWSAIDLDAGPCGLSWKGNRSDCGWEVLMGLKNNGMGNVSIVRSVDYKAQGGVVGRQVACSAGRWRPRGQG